MLTRDAHCRSARNFATPASLSYRGFSNKLDPLQKGVDPAEGFDRFNKNIPLQKGCMVN